MSSRKSCRNCYMLLRGYGLSDDPSPKKLKLTLSPMSDASRRSVCTHRKTRIVVDPDTGEVLVDYQEEHEKEKRLDNIGRAKNIIYEYAMCNEWDYFVTFTLDPRKMNRSDLEGFRKSLTRFIRDLSRRVGKINYLFVPELHADGVNWHIHGFISGLPETELHRLIIGDRMNADLVERVKRGDTVFTWPAYGKRYGFNELEPIRSAEDCAKYMMKYIVKALTASVKLNYKHLYYCSQGLNRAPRYTLVYENSETLEFEKCSAPSKLVDFVCENPQTFTFNVSPIANGSRTVSVLWIPEAQRQEFMELIESLKQKRIFLAQIVKNKGKNEYVPVSLEPPRCET